MVGDARVPHRRGFLLICQVENGGSRGGAIVLVREGPHAELFQE